MIRYSMDDNSQYASLAKTASGGPLRHTGGCAELTQATAPSDRTLPPCGKLLLNLSSSSSSYKKKGKGMFYIP